LFGKSAFFVLFVLIGGSTLAPQLAAADLIISRAMLVDVSGRLTIADVAGRVTAPARPSFAVGSTKAVHWLRLIVRKPADGDKVVLFVRPAYLNEVRLYEAGTGDPLAWKTRVTGSYYPFHSRDRARASLGFVVDVAGAEATFYLRLKTRSPSDFSVEALEPAGADRKDHQRDLVIVFFVTAMVFLLLWAILNYLVDRQPVVGLFAVHQAIYTLFGIVATGYLAPFAPAAFPQLVDWINAVLYFAIDFTTALFVRELFRPYDPPRAMVRGLDLFLSMFPFLVVAFFLGADTIAINVNTALFRVTWLYFVLMAFALRAESAPSRRLLRIFFTAVLCSNVISWVARSGARIALVPNEVQVLIQVLIIDGLIIGGLFAAMLHARARRIQQEAQQAALDLVQTQQSLKIEQELKKQAEIQAHTDYLTGAFSRRYFVELAERELTRSMRFRRPLTLCVIDIDHFKAVNDTWGHGVGDVVLQKVSQLIGNETRHQDIFGRTGGEEFAAVILETEGDEAIEIGQRLCDTVEAAVIVSPRSDRISVTLSIGLTQLNDRQIDFDTLMMEADRAMYSAKQAGRNRVVVNDGCQATFPAP
jgi:diguanylate cyclase (GGDEF)-like protein